MSSYLKSNFYERMFRLFLEKSNLAIYNVGKFLIEGVGSFLGFPQNLGLRYGSHDDTPLDRDFLFREILSKHTRQLEFLNNPTWGAKMRNLIVLEEETKKIPDIPANMFEVIFSKIPTFTPIQRVFFIDAETGYYNFYVQDYLNAQTLPDWFSELIQIQFQVHSDYSPVSLVRECMFGIVWIFYEIYQIRALLTIFIFLNPYVFPWLILTLLVDWLEELLAPFIPQGVLFLDLNELTIRFLIGSTLDNLNNLVLTFPYLPSEGKPEYIMDGAQTGPAIVFRGLPKLWYKHGIPNDMRQHWYFERQDIFHYFQQAYKDLDLQFLPDEIIEQINSQNVVPTSEIPSVSVPISDANYILENFYHLFNDEFLRNISDFFNK